MASRHCPGARRVRRLLAAAAALAGASLVWVGTTAVLARGDLQAARADARVLRDQLAAGHVQAARGTAERLADRADRAHFLTSGPAWAFVAAVPGVGEPFRSARGVASAVHGLGRAGLPALAGAGETLDPATLRLVSGSVDVRRVAALRPALDTASGAAQEAVGHLRNLPRRTWLPVVDDARAELLAVLEPVAETLRTAELAVRLLPPMLGAEGRRTYLLVFQNSAEARGTGGLPGVFAIVTVDQGRLSFDRFERHEILDGVRADVSLGPDYDALYRRAGTTSMFRNANLSPHFPYAARIWASMWERFSGTRVDGVLAIDPTALSYLLEVTRPARLQDGTAVTSANVGPLTQSTSYARFGEDHDGRRSYLLEVARAVAARVMDGATGEPLLRAAARAATERRLLVWSAHPAEQAALEQTDVAGAVPQTDAPYAGLSLVNAAGNKLDYYLDRALAWRRDACEPTRVTVTITLTNRAPARGLPPSTVAARVDRRNYPVAPGDHRLDLSYLATAGAVMQSVTVDGRPATARIGTERGHSVFVVDVEIPRARTRTVVLTLTEPDGGVPETLVQPLVRPMHVTLDNTAACGP